MGLILFFVVALCLSFAGRRFKKQRNKLLFLECGIRCRKLSMQEKDLAC
jgi:hypothetical protein